ncbi:MAG: ATP-binding protein [Lachnospiraceae bacterium]|jgi:anti-sigma regulatory factor (Ser/Thr protein kinase)|nr:ATP-binding protein [Lachnospiraceae bacterium]MBP5564494.1 ATP-binding protein [Lachnospiraceae bacterium]MCR4696130.1 ATP-binding protein [Lachnospiraceae bacterium]
MQELNIEAKVENLDKVIAFVDEEIDKLECSQKIRVQIDVAVEELFVNIAHYAYRPDVGPATVRVEVEKDPPAVSITFIDHGIPYDPLAKEDPDITLSAEERSIGGLGIFMVKKSMDDIDYEYKDGQNILHIRKLI